MIQDFDSRSANFGSRRASRSPPSRCSALGIGVNTAIFTLVNAMLFEPPAYQKPAEIVQLFSQDTKDPKSFRAFSYPDLTATSAIRTLFSQE